MFSLPTTTTKDAPRTLSLETIVGTHFLTIRQRLSGKREECDKYTLAEIGGDIGGRGFELVKITPNEPEAETYHVHVAGQRSTCECMGFLRHGRCEHLAAVQKIIDEELMHRDLPVDEDDPWSL